jgi:monoterpene epsilon-lactone hydrolase
LLQAEWRTQEVRRVVMARREGVAHASWPITVTDLGVLGASFAAALVRVPLRGRPKVRGGRPLENVAVAATRETIRTFMGYASSLPIEEWRSVELFLDDLCRVILPPLDAARGVETEAASVAGVPGVWYRCHDRDPRGTVVYLHGGGYIGTSPRMYGPFITSLCLLTGLEFFVADLRLAPEFPFPAALEDAALVFEAILHLSGDPARVFLAGDSSGGGLVGTLLYAKSVTGLPPIGGVLLFSPEVDLALDDPSVSDNAALDILPWNIPTAPYLHGRDPEAPAVSAVYQDLSHWPPTFVVYGSDEMFRDAIRRFVDNLSAAGVDHESHEEPGMFHVFPILMPWAAPTRRAFASLREFTDKHLPPRETDSRVRR